MSQLVTAAGPYLEQILRENFPIWGDGLSFPQYLRYWDAQLKTPWGASHLDRLALVEYGRVTSSAKRYDLSARIDGRIRRVLGIGAVFTSPERRGQGGAKRLIELIVEQAEAEGYEYAMLFSEIDPAFYERLDFVPVPLNESHVRVNARLGAPAALVRAGDDRDISVIADISRTRTFDTNVRDGTFGTNVLDERPERTSVRLALDRAEDWIRYGITKKRLLSGLGPAGLREVEFLVTEEAHTAVAYVISTVHQGQWFIEDVGDRDPSGARVGAMLQAMLARTPHLDHPEIVAWLPPGFAPPQVEIVEMRQTKDVMMLRPLADRMLPLPPLRAEDVTYAHLDYF